MAGYYREDVPEPPGYSEEPTPEIVEEQPHLWKNLLTAAREVVETIILTLIIFFLIQLVARNFRVVGSSMEPNLHDGQHLIVDKLSYRFHLPERGDIVVFHFPRDPSRDYIKRIIGLPGETVEIRQEQVYINGQILEEPYRTNPVSYSLKPMLVGPDEFFVLGDNRDSSSDSHNWGMLPKDEVIGKAWLSYWPPSQWGLVTHQPFVAAKE
jgi:signal peptidase I